MSGLGSHRRSAASSTTAHALPLSKPGWTGESAARWRKGASPLVWPGQSQSPRLNTLRPNRIGPRPDLIRDGRRLSCLSRIPHPRHVGFGPHRHTLTQRLFQHGGMTTWSRRKIIRNCLLRVFLNYLETACQTGGKFANAVPLSRLECRAICTLTNCPRITYLF